MIDTMHRTPHRHGRVLMGLLVTASACSIELTGTSSDSGSGGHGGEAGTGGTMTSSAGGGGAAGSGGNSQGSGGTAGQGGGPPTCARGRSTADRPDDQEGYQVRVNYVLPADGSDEMLDTNGQIATSVAAWSGWFEGQTGGRALRLDTCNGVLDIRFVQLDKTEATLKATGLFLRDAIEDELQQKGLLQEAKIEAVYYGGDADGTCGGGAWPPALIGHVAAVYLKGTFSDPGIPPCASNPVGSSADSPGYIDFSVLHEILHTLGVVPACAPHQTLAGHTSDSPMDLMYAGNEPWSPSVLDVGKDDYLDHGGMDCLDLAKSAFIDPLPMGAEPPPGW